MAVAAQTRSRNRLRAERPRSSGRFASASGANFQHHIELIQVVELFLQPSLKRIFARSFFAGFFAAVVLLSPI